MQLKKPAHATVVAYLALFAALGGTAIAARDNLGAKELKPLVVRKEKFRPSAPGGEASVTTRCRRNEEFIAGGGGWNRFGGDAASAPTISQASVFSAGQRPKGYVVRGRAPALNNTLVAQALCLPK